MIREQSLSNKSTDSSSQAPPLQPGENAANVASHAGQTGPSELQTSRSQNQVFKSGPLFISSKGIGWTSWKKRWFILTRTSLVFFRSDPSIAPQKAGETNLTLGGIDLNSSASVDVKADKKLLTVFFPDGRDGRAFTLKAETSDDLHEWKTALETAVAQAPTTSAAGQKGVFNSEEDEAPKEPDEQQNDKLPGKSMVIGRPVLLALEDIDGTPSFLEKALRFIEQHGVRIEGILRQAADVDHVHRRVKEYEQGKTEFSPGEDAHVIGDCIKYILRELPSSPVPATCCTALLEAFRSDRNKRLNNMRTAILETFPEPNRRLLQRILLMMQQIVVHKTENRMSVSAVAACMSPLLLRPLLAGECELENTHMDVAGDGSFQLLQAAAAANHAQAIVIILLEEYDNIFGEGSGSPESFSDSDASYSGTEEDTDDDDYDDSEDDSHDDASGTESDYEKSGSETSRGSDDLEGSNSYDDKKSESSSSSSKSSSSSSSKSRQMVHHPQSKQKSPSASSHQNDNMQRTHSIKKQKNVEAVAENDNKKSHRNDTPAETSSVNESVCHSPKSYSQKASSKLRGSASHAGRAMWGRTPGRKNLSMESLNFSLDDEEEIQWPGDNKSELENRIAEKTNHNNATVLENLEKRKKEIHERRLALEKEVARLQDELQKEKDIGAALESGDFSRLPAGIDEKTKAQLTEIALAEEKNNNLKQAVDDLGARVTQQHEKNTANIQGKGTMKQENSSRETMPKNNNDNASRDTSHFVGKPSINEVQKSDNMGGANHDKDGKYESSSSSKKNLQNDASRGTNNIGSQPSISLMAKSSAPKSLSLSSSSIKSGKGEERHTQIANERENLDKARGSPTQSSSKGKIIEEKNQGREGSSVFQNREDISCQLPSHTSLQGIPSGSDNKDSNNKKVSVSKSDSSGTNSDNRRKSESQPSQQLDKGQKLENQPSQQLDEGRKSEGQSSSRNVAKGQQHDGKHSNSNSKVTK